MRLLALLLLPTLTWAAPQPIRDTAYDWRCVNPDGTATNHQRQDTAIYACQTRAEQNPGQVYYIEGGRYRVVAEGPGPAPEPDPDPVPDPAPDPQPVSYDLGDIPAEYRAVEFAALPQTTRTVTVSTDAALSDALRLDGSRILVNAGSYGGRSITGSNLDLVLANGASFGGLSIRCQMCRISGGVFAGGGYSIVVLDEAQHVTLDNVSTENGVYAHAFNGRNPHHISILRSTIRSPSAGYGMLLTDVGQIIIAGSDISNFDGAHAGVRMVSVSDVVMVDSRVHTRGNRILRIHADRGPSTRHLYARNQFESTGNNNLWLGPRAGAAGGDLISNVTYLGNTYYVPQPAGNHAAFQIDADVGAGVSGISIRGMRFFSPDTRITDNAGVLAQIDTADNVFAAYRTPPAFPGGADH